MPQPHVHRVILLAGVVIVLCALIAAPAWADNPAQRENARAGTGDWQLANPAANREIEGYASHTSVNRGESLSLFVNTAEPSYTIDVYRMGWYGDAGARLILGGVRRAGVRQPMPEQDPATGLIECDWADPYVLTVDDPDDPTNWVSGVYLAKLTAGTSGKQSYIIFVVREDARPSEYLFQASVTTYQAYNNWGGKSLYAFNSTDGRPARKVSFDRPYAISPNPLAASGHGAGDFLTTNSVPPADPASPAGWEYNMVRWLEREGYDVTYSTSLDTHADPALLRRHKVWLSVGHDEYWTWGMRANIERALAEGVSLAFFSGNVSYWQIRFEPGRSTRAPNRTIVSYKDGAPREDPYALDGDPANDHLVTVRWREPPVNRPEEALIGVMYDGNPVDQDIVIGDEAHWVLSGTGLRAGDRLPGLLGYEADRRFGYAPSGTAVVAHSPYQAGQDTFYADMTVYRHPSGASVFAAGSIQWSWGLDDFNAPRLRGPRLHPAARQIARNVLARLAGDVFPAAVLRAPDHGRAGVPVPFDAGASSDPDGKITGYRWTFGDGQGSEGLRAEHVYERPGVYQAALTVTDDRGAASRAAAEIRIGPRRADAEAARP